MSTQRRPTVSVSNDGVSYHVDIDGLDISAGLRGVTLEMQSGELPRVVLDLITLDLRTYSLLDAASARVHPRAHEALVALGWSPPAEPDVEPEADQEASPCE